MSVHFAEWVPQKSLNQNALLPVLSRTLIYDNGASQKGKGTLFSLNGLTVHLRRHYRLHGNVGYILLIDFSDYFNNIDHNIAKRIIRDNFDDDGIVWLQNYLLMHMPSIIKRSYIYQRNRLGKVLGLAAK